MDREVEEIIYNEIIEKERNLKKDQLAYIRLCLNRCGGEIKLKYEKDRDWFPTDDFDSFEDQFPNQVNIDGYKGKITILLTRVRLERVDGGEVISIYGLCMDDMVEYRSDLFLDMFDLACDFIHECLKRRIR